MQAQVLFDGCLIALKDYYDNDGDNGYDGMNNIINRT